MEVLSSSPDYSVVTLDCVPEPCLALRSKTLFQIINLLDSCRGFVAGMKAKEDAVATNALLDRLNSIALDYEAVASKHGFELEVPKSQANNEFERARLEFEAILAKLDRFSKK